MTLCEVANSFLLGQVLLITDWRPESEWAVGMQFQSLYQFSYE